MSDFDLEIKTEFLIEALSNLGEVEKFYNKLEVTAESKPALEKMFFVAHNLKGGSLSVGFGDVAEFTSQLELLVLKIKNGEIPLTNDIVETLIRSNKRLIEMLTALQSNMTSTFDNKSFLVDIQSCALKVNKIAN